MTDPQGPWVAPVEVRERVSRLLCDLVAIPSHGGQEGAIIQYLMERFARQDIPCRVTAVDGKPLNVVAEIGQGPRTFLLNSHVDTVPPGDPALWATDPLIPVEKNGRIYGRGAEDAKGCLASMIVAFERLAMRRDALPARVVLMAVGAEERGGLGTQAEMAKGFTADAAIIGESTHLVPMLAHKGVLRLEIEVAGRAAHASDPDAGINAIVAVAPIVSALDQLAAAVRRRTDPFVGKASLVISTIAGGVALNVIPAQCVITIDRRVLPQETEADVLGEIVAVVNQALPAASGATAAIRSGPVRPPVLHRSGRGHRESGRRGGGAHSRPPRARAGLHRHLRHDVPRESGKDPHRHPGAGEHRGGSPGQRVRPRGPAGSRGRGLSGDAGRVADEHVRISARAVRRAGPPGRNCA